MEYCLEGKIAGITGGADQLSIGFAIAKTLLREGCKCFIIDVDRSKLETAKSVLSNYGEIEAYYGDVSSLADMKVVIEQVVEKYGRIDIYVNNAGICPNISMEDMTEAEWDRGMGINLKSIFISSKLVIPFMPSGGTIINAASFVSLIPTAGLAMYSASKAGVLSLTRVMAAEYAAKGIRVNCYIPGLINTKMNRQRIESIPERLKSQIASGTFGTPQDVANAVVFLASDSAAYVNGTYIEVSGGKFCTQNPDWSWSR